jgi:hypothetical protein
MQNNPGLPPHPVGVYDSSRPVLLNSETVGSNTWLALNKLAPAKDSSVPAEEDESNEVKKEELVDESKNLWEGE